MTGYNGWSNYETWCVKLWADNDEAADLLHTDKTRAARGDVGNLADALREEYEDKIPANTRGTLWGDLLVTSLASVDWDEIAEALIEDYYSDDD